MDSSSEVLIPMTVRFKKLKSLLERTFGSAENSWISTVDAENAVLDAGEKGELDHWVSYYYYMERDRVNDERRTPVDGFESLMRNLDTTRAQSAVIHRVFDESGRLYRVFTDPEIGELIGVLRFPISNPAIPYPVKVRRIKDLVGNAFGSEENPWISKSDMETAIFRISYGDGIPVSVLRRTYEVRGQLNEERGNGIEGFDRLLKNFTTTQATEGVVHKVVDRDQREYALFTDPAISELFGILRFPEGWMNRPSVLDSLKRRRNSA
jgi:hypothetical protein